MPLGKRLAVATTGLLLGGVSLPCYGLYSGNEILFPPALKVVCLASSLFSNVQISFGEAHGSLKEGRLRIQDAKIKSVGNTTKDFDLKISNLEVVYGPSLLDFVKNIKENIKKEIHVQKLFAKGVSGKIDIKEVSTSHLDFHIHEVSLEDIQLGVTDHTQKVVKSGPFTFPPMTLYRMYGQDICSKTLAKDIFMKSSLLAALDDGVLGLESRENGVHVVAKNLPLGLISEYLYEPFSWFSQAVVDAEIEDIVKDNEHFVIVDMRLQKLVPDPKNATKSGKIAVPVLAKYLKHDHPTINIKFSMKVDDTELTAKRIAQQIAAKLMAKAVEEGRARIGQGLKEGRDHIEKGWKEGRDHIEKGWKKGWARIEQGWEEGRDHIEQGWEELKNVLKGKK